MTPSYEPEMPPRRRWMITAIVCAALLLVPVIGWLAFPAPHVTPRTSAPPKTARTEVAASITEAPNPPRPRSSAAPAAQEVEPEATDVTGLVLDPDGKPVARAFVECDDKDRGVAGAASDADGKFRLPISAVGCDASATHATWGPSEPVRLEKGRENTLHLTRGGRISGLVVDEQGNPVKTYVIAVESFIPKGEAPAQRMVGKTESVDDPSGAFELDGLVAGRFVLTASAADGRPPAQSEHIDVEAGATARGVRVTLPRGATLVGKVTDAETRLPVAGVSVGLDFATVSGANAISSVTTDASGAYTLVGAPAGSFSVRFAHPDYKIRVVSGLAGRGGATLKQDIELHKGTGGKGEIETDGIGAFLYADPKGGVKVMAVLKDSPAERAGLMQFDMIARIDGRSTEGMSTVDATQTIRGAPGTRTTLSVTREGGKSVDITIARETIVR